jgi:nicotinamide mononucleotide (NMN) deamidase PncC
VLERTPEADYALAITGHLGPDAPPDRDGQVFVTAVRRSLLKIEVVRECRCQLTEQTRVSRQHEAAIRALETFRDVLEAAQA